MWIPGTNSDSMDQAPWVGPRPAFWGATGWFWCSQPTTVLDPLPRAPYSNQLKSFHSKGDLNTTITSVVYIFFNDYLEPFCKSRQDHWHQRAGKYPGCRHWSNNPPSLQGRETSLHTLISCRSPKWWVPRHGNQRLGSGRRKEPRSEIALNSVTALRMAEKAQQLTDEPGLEL